MVPITKGQRTRDDAKLVVASDDGQYADTDLILCADATAPDVPTAMFAAQFIAYGAVVYQFNTPEEIGEAVYAMDKSSTLDSVKLYLEDQARKHARDAGTLEPDNPTPAPDAIVDPSSTPPDATTTAQDATTTQDTTSTPVDPAPVQDTTTQATSGTTDTNTSAGGSSTDPATTTTPVIDTTTSTSTPIVDPSVGVDASTTDTGATPLQDSSAFITAGMGGI